MSLFLQSVSVIKIQKIRKIAQSDKSDTATEQKDCRMSADLMDDAVALANMREI